MRDATVVQSRQGAFRVIATMPGCRAVFVDSSPADGGLWARAFPHSENVERLAAAEFVATAMRAVAAAGQQPDGQVDVIGRGLLGQLVKRLLRPGACTARPNALIDATGADASVQRALSEVESLGTVVLAAPVTSPSVPVAGYADIHKRGLTVVGVQWARESADAPGELVEWALANLARAPAGEPATLVPWYRVDL